MAGRGKSDPHKHRREEEDARGNPEIHVDYCFHEIHDRTETEDYSYNRSWDNIDVNAKYCQKYDETGK